MSTPKENDMGEIPKEIVDAVNELEECEKNIEIFLYSGDFVDQIKSLIDLKNEYPSHSRYIDNVAKSYSKQIFIYLYEYRPDIDDDLWLELLFFFLITMKGFTSELIMSNDLYKNYFVSFLYLFAEKTPRELSLVVDELIREQHVIA